MVEQANDEFQLEVFFPCRFLPCQHISNSRRVGGGKILKILRENGRFKGFWRKEEK
jgi:hypothetical protein